MSVTMSADAHTQMTNEINALGKEVRELKKEVVPEMAHEINSLGKEIRKLKKENQELKKNEKAYENKIFCLEQEIRGLNTSLAGAREVRKRLDYAINKLTEENEELKTSVQSTENYWKSKFENAQKEVSRHRLVAGNLDEENKKLKKQIDSMESEVLDAQDSYALQKQTEQVYYHGEPLMCIEDGTPITISDVFPNKLKKEIESLKKSNKQKTNIIRRIRAEAEAYTVMYDDGK